MVFEYMWYRQCSPIYQSSLLRHHQMPWIAAVVGAPILKLWPLYRDISNPMGDRTLRTKVTNVCLVRALPLQKRSKGPGSFPLMTRYCSTAATGHNESPVTLTIIWSPFLNGSVFDCWIQILKMFGWVWWSVAMSAGDKWQPGSKCVVQISPAWRKPKKQRLQAAQIISVSLPWLLDSQ